MKYYLLSRNLDKKEIGEYPQSKSWHARDSYHIDAPFSFRKLMPYTKPPSDIRFPIFKLHGRAKRTDMLSASYISTKSMIINDKFKEVIRPFHVPLIEEYNVIVESRKKDYPYTFIHFAESCEKHINFDNSTFLMEDFLSKTKIENIVFRNLEDYNYKQSQLEGVSSYFPTKLEISLQDAPDFMVFSGKSHKLISERLANELINQKITGIKIQALSEQKIGSKIDFTFV